MGLNLKKCYATDLNKKVIVLDKILKGKGAISQKMLTNNPGNGFFNSSIISKANKVHWVNGMGKEIKILYSLYLAKISKITTSIIAKKYSTNNCTN